MSTRNAGGVASSSDVRRKCWDVVTRFPGMATTQPGLFYINARQHFLRTTRSAPGWTTTRDAGTRHSGSRADHRAAGSLPGRRDCRNSSPGSALYVDAARRSFLAWPRGMLAFTARELCPVGKVPSSHVRAECWGAASSSDVRRKCWGVATRFTGMATTQPGLFYIHARQHFLRTPGSAPGWATTRDAGTRRSGSRADRPPP
jgi:hypothetical protein